MKLISRYFIREMILPFIFSLLMITFLLFINFLLRAIDRFLGKGIDLLTILEYLFLNLAWIIALSVPMAVLLATLMAFGRLSEDNEINAMRASGIGFLTIIRAPIMFGIITALLLVFFNNFILPEMNYKARLLSGDIYRKRPGMNIEPGVFIDDLPAYSMIIGGKKNDIMSEVRIFSKGKQKEQTSIHAKTGKLTTLSDAFLLTLFNGEIHELENKDFTNYRRIIFDIHKIIIPANDILLNRRDSSKRSDREMTIPMIIKKVEEYDKKLKMVNLRIQNSFYRALGDSLLPTSLVEGHLLIQQIKNKINSDTTISKANLSKKERQLRNLERQIKNEFGLITTYLKGKNKYKVEAHKKVSIPFACILFVLLGAPLGVMSKKGGFAISTSLSFGFFLIYYIFLIGGEELADRNQVSPEVGMWAPNFIVLLIALYLILHTIRERAPIPILSFIKFKKTKE